MNDLRNCALKLIIGWHCTAVLLVRNGRKIAKACVASSWILQKSFRSFANLELCKSAQKRCRPPTLGKQTNSQREHHSAIYVLHIYALHNAQHNNENQRLVLLLVKSTLDCNFINWKAGVPWRKAFPARGAPHIFLGRLIREAPLKLSPGLFGHCPNGGGSQRLPRWFGALI